jgi:hypothetical protein
MPRARICGLLRSIRSPTATAGSRAIADLMLARSEQSSQRFYGMSTQIRAERAEYYRLLEAAQRATSTLPLDGVARACLGRAIKGAEVVLIGGAKGHVLERHRGVALN